MDIEAKPIGNDIWTLCDLLGRKVGTIVQTSGGFILDHDDSKLLAGIERGPHPSLEAAMLAIERKTDGACRVVSP